MKKALLFLVASIPLFLISCSGVDDSCDDKWNQNIHYIYGDLVTYDNNCWCATKENINVGPTSDTNKNTWIIYVALEDDEDNSNTSSCISSCDDYYSWDGACSCHCH